MRATVSAARSAAAGLLLLVALVGAQLVGLAAPSAADVLPFRGGRLTIRIEALGDQYLLCAPAGGEVGGVVNAERTATTLTSFTLPAGSFSVTGVTVPVTNPALQPITGLIGSFVNSAGSFGPQGGGFLGGPMGLRFPPETAEPGLVEICILFACDEALQYIPVELGVVGIGGEETFEDLITFSITGGPWTTGTATVPVDGGQESETGSVTLLGDGYLDVRLVTPIAIEIDNSSLPGIPAQIAAFGLLDLEIAPVPEPGAATAALAASAALAALARRRRVQSEPRASGARSSPRSAPSAKLASR